ncbi:AfsR/SARP family transcriptional regulator [Streptomyces boninensis]|uniref:AfsR/SARP family transcriptional regulator n=1 Tax=Streptomyces boninensis TaxID=2039455 RepID=UPI003B20F2B0
MIFEMLGPLRVGGAECVGSPVRRAMLIAFLLRARGPISSGELAGLLWDEPPASATANIRSHLTGLRRDLDAAVPGLSGRIITYRGVPSGYGLQVAPDELDLTRFTSAARRGRSLLLAGELEAAIGALEEAMELWRGPFGSELPPTRWFDAHAAGLNDARIDAFQDLFTAHLLARRTDMLSYRIESVLAEAPYRQRLWELLAAVHCVEGEAVGALDVIQRCQGMFSRDLGLDLPPNIEELRNAALNWDRDEALRLVEARAVGSVGAVAGGFAERKRTA